MFTDADLSGKTNGLGLIITDKTDFTDNRSIPRSWKSFKFFTREVRLSMTSPWACHLVVTVKIESHVSLVA